MTHLTPRGSCQDDSKKQAGSNMFNQQLDKKKHRTQLKAIEQSLTALRQLQEYKQWSGTFTDYAISPATDKAQAQSSDH